MPVQGGPNRVFDTRCIQPTFTKLLFPGCVIDPAIRHPQRQHPDFLGFPTQVFKHRRPGTTGSGVVFKGYEELMSAGQLINQRVIQRFHKAHIDQGQVESLGHLLSLWKEWSEVE